MKEKLLYMENVREIYICPDKGLPMIPIEIVRAIKGTGLEGDRYALGKGAYSNSKRITIRQVSLISIEAIEEANKALEVPFTPLETRRNIITKGVDLNLLVGKCFMVGNVIMRGVELCDPCTRPSVLIKKKGFEEAFFQKGGLRAEILSDGVISIGDHIII